MNATEKLARVLGALEHAIAQADGEPGDAQRALQELRDEYRQLYPVPEVPR